MLPLTIITSVIKAKNLSLKQTDISLLSLPTSSPLTYTTIPSGFTV